MPQLPTKEEVDKARLDNFEKFKDFRPLLWKNMPLYPTRYQKRAEKGLPQHDWVFGFIDPDNHATYGWTTLDDLMWLVREPMTYDRIITILQHPCTVVFDETRAKEFKTKIEKEFNKEYDFRPKERKKVSKKDQPTQLTLPLQSDQPSEFPFDVDSNKAAGMVWDDDDEPANW